MNIALVAADTVWKDVNKNIDLAEEHAQKIKQLFPATQVILFRKLV